MSPGRSVQSNSSNEQVIVEEIGCEAIENHDTGIFEIQALKKVCHHFISNLHSVHVE